MTDTISWDDFARVEIRVGTVIDAQPFPEARKPAFKLWVDFGAPHGVRKTSAQLTAHYRPDTLIGRQVGPFLSEFLVLGFPDAEGAVVLVQPSLAVPNGGKLF
jgi:tRNA-binding protein